MEQILQVAGIPLLTAVACIYFGIKVMVFKDTDCIRGSMAKELRDKESYAKYAGILLFALAFCSLLMAVLLFLNTVAAAVEIGVSLVAVMAAWAQIEKKFGTP